MAIELKFTGYGEEEEVELSIPVDEVIKAFWKESVPAHELTISTGNGDERACAHFILDPESSSHQSIAVMTENTKTYRNCSWFRLELPTKEKETTHAYLYGGNTATEHGSVAAIVDGVRSDDDDSRRVLWVNKENTHVETWHGFFSKHHKAITEEQLRELADEEHAMKFDFDSYGKNLAANPNNTIEYVSCSIVSKNKTEIDFVVANLNAMGIPAATGRYSTEKFGYEEHELAGYYYVKL